MVYAQVKDGIVSNTIVVDETTPLELFSKNFDHFLRIDDLEVVPGVGWGYEGGIFIAPPSEEPPQ